MIPCFQCPSSAHAKPIEDRPVHQASADSQATPAVLAIPAAMDVPVRRDRLVTKDHPAQVAIPDRKAHLANLDRCATRLHRSPDAKASLDSLDNADLLANPERLETTATTASPDDVVTTDVQVHLDALAPPAHAASLDHPAKMAAATTAHLHVWRQAIRRRTQVLNSHASCDCAYRHITSLS
jgi:hypothetical protein